MRLIYFGKLLEDNMKLRDFIRIVSIETSLCRLESFLIKSIDDQGNEEIVHNIHIVYKNFIDDQVESNQNTSTQSATEDAVDDSSTSRLRRPSQQIKTKKEIERLGYAQIHAKLREYYAQVGLNSTGNPWSSTYLQHTALYHHM
jgi:hypothetical protein